MAFDRQQASDDFEEFLMVMDDQLDWLREQASTHDVDLDGTPGDLEKLEELFDLMTKGKDSDYVSKLTVTFGRYVGELVRTNFGGKWTIVLDDEKNVYFNMPVIEGHCPVEGVLFSPLFTMRAYAKRKKRGMLRIAVEDQVNPQPLDLRHLIEEEQRSTNAGNADFSRVEAGRPCPRSGYWFAPAASNSRRYFKQGTVMPKFESSYGDTIWQWSDDQSDPKLV